MICLIGYLFGSQVFKTKQPNKKAIFTCDSENRFFIFIYKTPYQHYTLLLKY